MGKVYLAIDDECSVKEYFDGVRIEAFTTDEARQEFILRQPNFGDWQIRDLDLLSQVSLCTICANPTSTACSDCQINLATAVYVCGSKYCMNIHEKNCPNVLKKQIEAIAKKVLQ